MVLAHAVVDAKGSLQWVHGPRTVVMRIARVGRRLQERGFNGSTVREPWLWPAARVSRLRQQLLQWVHGPRTVVMIALLDGDQSFDPGFNGSTVR